MSDRPLLTCVIAVFNGERYLPEAIESVLVQEGHTVEIVVVDDGSTDGTRDAVQRFGKRVQYVHQDNAGPASARNRGIGHAAGELIAFLDADDLWHPNKTTVQATRFQERPALVACTTHVQNFVSADDGPGADIAADPMLSRTQPGTASTFVAHRSLFDTVGLLEPQYKHRDIQDLIVRATDAGLTVETLPDVLVSRRIHTHNMSWSRSGEDQLELVAITRSRLARRRASRT
jgi:glycosyltransferase involved in cell wall biosynthesis